MNDDIEMYGLTPESIDRLILQNMIYDDECTDEDVETFIEEFFE